jgi:hypothetical protein
MAKVTKWQPNTIPVAKKPTLYFEVAKRLVGFKGLRTDGDFCDQGRDTETEIEIVETY